MNPDTSQNAIPISISDRTALGTLANKLDRNQGTSPWVLTGAGRAATGSGDPDDPDEFAGEASTATMASTYLSLMAARALNQFMNPEVISDSVR